eukprot:31340-Pelagococcus_subviridis.AAC.10
MGTSVTRTRLVLQSRRVLIDHLLNLRHLASDAVAKHARQHHRERVRADVDAVRVLRLGREERALVRARGAHVHGGVDVVLRAIHDGAPAVFDDQRPAFEDVGVELKGVSRS